MSILSLSHSHSHSHSLSLSLSSHCQPFVVMIWSHTIHALYVYRYTFTFYVTHLACSYFFWHAILFNINAMRSFQKNTLTQILFFFFSLPTRASSIELKRNETKCIEKNKYEKKNHIYIFIQQTYHNCCVYHSLFFFFYSLLCRFSSYRS